MPAPGLDNAWLVPGAKMVTPSHIDVMRGVVVCQIEADRASIEGIRLLNQRRSESPESSAPDGTSSH